MTRRPVARDVLWDLAVDQHGLVTAEQAIEAGVSTSAIKSLVYHGRLERVAHGVYRLPKYPTTEAERYALAVLWSRRPNTALSHETALDLHDATVINPDRIHITVPRGRPLRRTDAERYVVHYEDLNSAQVGWWQQVPMVRLGTAIRQCIEIGTPTYLLRQALLTAERTGAVPAQERDSLAAMLEKRDRG